MKSLIDEVHCYSISKTKDGRYVTYVPDVLKPNGRRQIRKTSKAELYDYLVAFYNLADDGDRTFEVLFNEWIEYKKQFVNVKNVRKGLSPSTIRRYERDFDNYIKDLKLAQMQLKNITKIVIEKEIIAMIVSNSMTEKCAKNVISIIRQCITYAWKSKYTSENPVLLIDLDLLLANCRPEEIKADSERVLTVKELNLLLETTRRHEAKHPHYMPDYAIELSILTGMRVGEIAVLNWQNITEETIHVHLAERRYDYKDKKSELVIGEPKNHKFRYVMLTSEIKELLERIKLLNLNHSEGYVFVRDDGRRYTAHDISCAVNRRAKEAELTKGSIHGVRRSISSLLNTIIPQKTTAQILGHSERVNENHYNYSIIEKSEEKDALSRVSSSVINYSNEKKMKK